MLKIYIRKWSAKLGVAAKTCNTSIWEGWGRAITSSKSAWAILHREDLLLKKTFQVAALMQGWRTTSRVKATTHLLGTVICRTLHAHEYIKYIHQRFQPHWSSRPIRRTGISAFCLSITSNPGLRSWMESGSTSCPVRLSTPWLSAMSFPWTRLKWNKLSLPHNKPYPLPLAAYSPVRTHFFQIKTHQERLIRVCQEAKA